MKTMAQKAGLPTDIEVAKTIKSVIKESEPKVPKAVKVPAKEVKRVRKVLVDQDNNIVQIERKKRVLTEEQRDVLRERLSKAREIRAKNRADTAQ